MIASLLGRPLRGFGTHIEYGAPVQMANQLGMVFAGLDCDPRWRERLGQLTIPTLVVHGRRDPFLPIANGEALAREINGSRLLVLEHASTAIPDAASEEVATAMLELEIQAHNCHGFPIDHY